MPEWVLDDNLKVWRYMSFSRFVWLLHFKQLWLARADTLDDPWEAALAGNQLEHVIARRPIRPLPDITPEEPILDRAKRINALWRTQIYVNCWCALDHESHALWRIFCGPTEGVALQTTLGRLKAHFENIPISPIEYGQPGSARRTPTPFDLATKKRKMFAYESEIRVIALHDHPNPKLLKGEFGFSYPFDPSEMLDSLVVHPEADASFMEAVVASVDHHAPALRGRVTWSSMKERPPLLQGG